MTVLLLDSDHDGMPDEWELAHGLNPFDPTDATADPDHDGMTNLQEYIAGTDPHDPLSVLKVRLLSGGGGATVQFTANSNISYTIQYRTNLAAGQPWFKLSDLPAQPSKLPRRTPRPRRLRPGTPLLSHREPDPAARRGRLLTLV